MIVNKEDYRSAPPVNALPIGNETGLADATAVTLLAFSAGPRGLFKMNLKGKTKYIGRNKQRTERNNVNHGGDKMYLPRKKLYTCMNKLPMVGNKLCIGINNVYRGANKLSIRGDKLSRGGDKLSRGGDKLFRGGNKLCRGSNNVAWQRESLPQQRKTFATTADS